MWTPSSLIVDAVSELNLCNDSFRILPDAESSKLIDRVKSTFLSERNAIFWWEFLKHPYQSWKPESDAYTYLCRLVPNKHDTIWLIPHDDPADPVFETSTSVAAQVIGECAAFEYAICDTGLEWMIIENDHDCLFATGDIAIERLNLLKRPAR